MAEKQSTHMTTVAVAVSGSGSGLALDAALSCMRLVLNAPQGGAHVPSVFEICTWATLCTPLPLPASILLFRWLGPVSASVPFYKLLTQSCARYTSTSLPLLLSVSLLPSRLHVHNEPLSLCILMTFRRCLLCELIFVAAN